MSADEPLAGKVAVVAGGGIGRAIAIAHPRAGAKVVVAPRTPSTVTAVAQEIQSAGAASPWALHAMSRRLSR